jgi:hypothetical protein
MLSLFHLSLFSFSALLVMRKSPLNRFFRVYLRIFPIVLYRYRASLPLPQSLRSFISRPSAHNYAPLSTFAEQAAAGITSSNFDIEADNLREGDSRMGLDEVGTREVMEIMRRENVKCVLASQPLLLPPLIPMCSCSFDQARLIRHNRYLAANGIDPSGTSVFTARPAAPNFFHRHAPRCQGDHAPVTTLSHERIAVVLYVEKLLPTLLSYPTMDIPCFP